MQGKIALHFQVKFDHYSCAVSSTVTIDFKLADIKVESSEAEVREKSILGF